MQCQQYQYNSHQQEYTSLSHLVEATCLASYSAQNPAQALGSTLLNLQEPMIRSCMAAKGACLPAHLLPLHETQRKCLFGAFSAKGVCQLTAGCSCNASAWLQAFHWGICQPRHACMMSHCLCLLIGPRMCSNMQECPFWFQHTVRDEHGIYSVA